MTDDHQANARLIAQAPTMATLLEEAIRDCPSPTMEEGEFLEWFYGWQDRAREALKAAGVEA